MSQTQTWMSKGKWRLQKALEALKEKKTTVIVITHRPGS